MMLIKKCQTPDCLQQKTGNDIIRTVNRKFERIVHMDKVWTLSSLYS